MRKWAGRTTLLILTLWITSAAGRVLWAQVSPIQGIPSPSAVGSVTVTGTATVAGAKTNNAAVPGATNIGAFPCIANAAAPTWTETFLVALSCNLAGDLRVVVSNAVALGQATMANSTPVVIASNQTAFPVSLNPSTTGGWDTLNATAADGATACTNTAQAVKASAGAFGGFYFDNPNTADEWLQIYNVASGSVTVGTTAPKLTYRIPGATANSVGGTQEIANGITFGTAIAIACTSTAGGNGAPANALEVDIYFK